MNNTVTVLIPTYKRPLKLKRAIESVLAQTYADLIVIVFDNASEDETTDVVNAIMQTDNRVEYFRHHQNIGMNANFNFAVSKVETPFFTMLTDDDYQLPNYLQDAMIGFEKYPKIDCSIVSAPTILESGEVLGNQVESWPKEGLYEPGEAMSELISGRHPILTACIFRKNLKEVIYFEDKFSAISDLPVLAKILTNYSICLRKKVGLYFVLHQSNAGRCNLPIECVLNTYISIRESLANADKIKPSLKIKLKAQLEHYITVRELKLLLRALSERDCRVFSVVFTEMQSGKPSFYKFMAQTINFLTRSVFLSTVMSCLLHRYKVLRSDKVTAKA